MALNNREFNIYNILVESIQNDNIESFKSAMNIDIDLDIPLTCCGATVLSTAVLYNKTDMVKVLLDDGIDINVHNSNGDIVLVYAEDDYEGYKIVNFLIDAGIDIDSRNSDGSTILIIFARDKSTEMVDLLIDADAEIDIQNNEGDTALITSIMENNIDVVKLLIEVGADVNIQNKYKRTALISASIFIQDSNSFDIVKLLIDAGADANIKDDSGYTALDYITRKIKREAENLKQNTDMSELLMINTKCDDKKNYSDYIVNMIIKEAKKCPVCYADFTISNIYIGKTCDHPVCKVCLANIDKCPICRNDIFK